MREDYQRVKNKFLKLKAERELLEKQLEEKQRKLEELKKRLDNLTKARIIIQKVAEQTQSQLEFHLSSLVTKALHSVFPDPYNFKVQFVSKRNKTECELLFEKNGEVFSPLSSSGGGPVDVASFALRLVFWSLKRTRPVFILDETFRFVSSDLHSLCSSMMKSLSDKLGVQIILVSHSQNIIESADKVFEVRLEKGVSIVRER